MAETRDQAAGLRRMLRPGRVRVLPVAAGMRGTGKTSIVLALARAAAEAGRHTVILDHTRGEVANALSLTWRRELADLLEGTHDYADVVLAAPGGAQLLPAARGLSRLIEAGEDGRRLFGGFAQLSAPPRLVILNLPTKDASGCTLVPAEAETLLVARPTAPSVTATYARIKDMVRRHGRRRFRLLVNRADDASAQSLHATVAEVARRFLDAEVGYAGAIASGALDARPLQTRLDRWPLAEF